MTIAWQTVDHSVFDDLLLRTAQLLGQNDQVRRLQTTPRKPARAEAAAPVRKMRAI